MAVSTCLDKAKGALGDVVRRKHDKLGALGEWDWTKLRDCVAKASRREATGRVAESGAGPRKEPSAYSGPPNGAPTKGPNWARNRVRRLKVRLAKLRQGKADPDPSAVASLEADLSAVQLIEKRQQGKG